MKFKSDIEIQAGVEAGGSTGSNGQVLSSTGSGVAWIDQNAITSATDFVFFNVKNETGSTISKGKGVMAVGTDGNSGHILVDEMVADGTVESKYFLGVLEEDIANGAFARVISFGQLSQFNTNGQNGETWADGQVLWCDPANNGDFTITEPDGPNVKIAAAFILNKATNGKIQVRVQANEGIHDLHDTKITSQVDGDVLVWDNTTGVWFNDSTLNVDYTNGRVGIGTTDPQAKLHINRTTLGEYFRGGSGGLRELRFSTYNTASDHAGHKIDASSGNGEITLATGGSARLTVDNTGNVGIGTTSPDNKLEIVGSNALRIHDGTDQGAIFFRGDRDDVYIIESNYQLLFGAPSGMVFELDTNSNNGDFFNVTHRGSSRFYINGETGNVGIGTTGPGAKLHVLGSGENGGILFNNSGAQEHRFYSSANSQFNAIGSSTPIWYWAQYTGVGVEPNYKMTLNNTGLGIGTTSPSQKLDVNGYARATSGFVGNSGLSLFGDNSSTNRVFITTGGSVGIGTTSPSDKLDVSGRVVADAFRTDVNTGDYSVISRSSAGNPPLYVQSADSSTNQPIAKFFYGNASPNQGSLVLNVGKDLSYFTNTNVGIGTTNPIGKLNIEKSAEASIPALGANTSFLKISNTGGNYGSMIGQLGSGNTYFQVQRFDGTATAYNLLLQPNGGNVGIGTDSPSEKLNVDGNILATGTILGSNLSGTNTGDQDLSGYLQNSGITTHSGLISFTGTGSTSGIRFNSATVANDAFGIRVNGTSNDGELEFYSTDDDTEPFVFRHYTVGQDGTGTSAEWFRIGAGGDVTAAGTITASNFSGTSSGTNTGDQDLSGYLLLAGGTMTGNLTLSYAYPRINLYDTNNDSDYSIINNDGSFSIYDVTNNSHRLSIASGGNATFAGDVSISGGDLNVGNSSTVNSVINMLGTNDSFIEKDTGNHLYIANNVGDKDIKFRVKDDTTNIIALTIDGSEGGNATFSGDISAANLSGTNTGDQDLSGYAITADLDDYLPLTAGSSHPLTGDLYIEGADKALRINNGTQPVVYLGDGGANTDGQLILYNSSGNANIVLNGDNQNHYITNGNVGIGTTNPQQKLRVASPSSTSVVLGASYLSTNNNNFFEVGILANDGYLNLRNSGVQTTVHIDSDGNSFLNGGNVGIGATSPSAKLHIDGDLIITDTPQGQGDFLTVNPVSGKVTSVSSRDVSFGEAYINNYRSRVLDYGGTYFPTGAAGNVAKHKSNNLFNLMSMMLLPGGVFSGKVTAAKPKTGVDFTWTRTTVANYTNEEGVITEAPIATPRIDYANNSNGEILIEPTRTNLVPNSGPGNYGNGPGSATTVPGPNGVYNSAIVPVPDSTADRYQYSIAANTHNDGDVFTYSWYRRRLSTPIQDAFVGDLNVGGLVNCTLTGATTQIESNISGFDRFACQITITSGNTEALVRGYFGALIGIGNSSIAYFGQQLELGNFATTLINTAGSAVTRDNDYMIVNNLSDTIFKGMVGQGGMYMDFDYKREGDADGLRFYDENNITPRVYLYQGITGISDTWNAGNFPLNQTSGNKIGYMFTSTTSAVYCANGANIVTSSPTAAHALDSPLDTLYIDGNQNLVRIRELSMFTQMTNEQLVTLTTL